MNVGGDREGTITFTVTAEQAGEHVISVYYCTWDDRQLKALVNGQEYIVSCKGAGSWDKPAPNPAELTVSMHKGENKIVFAGVGTSPAPNLDWFEYNRTDSEENKEIDKVADELDTALLKAEELFSAGQKNYTDESWTGFETAYERALNPIGAVTAEDLSEIKDELINAQNELKEKENSDNNEIPDEGNSSEETDPSKEELQNDLINPESEITTEEDRKAESGKATGENQKPENKTDPNGVHKIQLWMQLKY